MKDLCAPVIILLRCRILSDACGLTLLPENGKLVIDTEKRSSAHENGLF